MPLYETVCYCSGPIKIEKVSAELKDRVTSYKDRKWLYLLGKANQ